MTLTETQLEKVKGDGITARAVAEQLGVPFREAVRLLKEAGATSSNGIWKTPCVEKLKNGYRKFHTPSQSTGEYEYADRRIPGRKKLLGGFRMKEKS